MKYKSLNFINNYLLDIITKETDNILVKISNDYNLEYDMLKKKYLNDKQISKNTIIDDIIIDDTIIDDTITDDTITDDTITDNTITDDTITDNIICTNVIENTINICNKNIVNNVKNTIDAKIRCLGIIKSGAQCARTRKNDSEFCLIHQKSLKYGKIHIFNQM